MRRIAKYFVAAMGMVAAVACNKEFSQDVRPEQNGNEYTFTATIGVETKTVLDGMKSMWMGDADGNEYIHVLDNEGNRDTYVAAGITEPTSEAEFKFSGETATLTGNSVVAIYPSIYGDEWNPTGVIAEEGLHSATVIYKSEQAAVEGSYDPQGPVAMAYIDDLTKSQSFSFKNMSALLKFSLAADSDPVDNVTLYIPNEGDGCLSGTVIITEEEGVYSFDNGTNPQGWVALNGKIEPGKTYYIAVAPGTVSGLTFQMNKDQNQEVTINRSITFERNRIYDLGNSFTYVAPELGSGWALPGGYNNWNISTSSTYLFEVGNYFVAKNVNVMDVAEGAEGGFKFYHAEFGWKGVGSTDAVALGEWHKLNGENNITLADDVAYDIYMTTDGKNFQAVLAGSPVPAAPEVVADYWGLIGSMVESGWGKDLVLVEEGDYWVYKGISLTATDEFKFRKNGEYEEQKIVQGGKANPDTEYDLMDSGANNMKVSTDGVYDIYMTKDITKVYFMTNGKTPDEATKADKQVVEIYANTNYTSLWAWLPDEGDLNLTGGSWPGYTATEVLETIGGVTYTKKWTLSVPSEHMDKNLMIVFSNGSSQTADSGPYTLTTKMYFSVDNGTVSQR